MTSGRRPYRIAVGRLWQETNTFSDARTTLADFERFTFHRENQLLDHLRQQDDELAGFADALDECDGGVEYVPLLSASTWCGGPAREEVVAAVTREVDDGLRRGGSIDGVLFSMHGALAGEQTLDITGHVLSRIRRVIGPRVPLVATLDHHANVTMAMVQSCNAMTAYRHCPHTDMRETGRRGAELLLGTLEHRINPNLSFRKIPMVTPCEGFRTAEPPMKNWFDLARQSEGRAGVLDVSTFPVQPWLDVPELGWSVLAVTDQNAAVGAEVCATLSDHAWVGRREFFVRKYEPAEAVRVAAAHPQRPVVIADGADATNGGSPGDSTCLLREMIAQGIRCPAALTIVDAPAVAAACAAGVGAMIRCEIGARWSRRFHEPLDVTARVANLVDGQFQIAGHLAMRVDMGRCAVLEIGPVRVLASEYPGPGHDPAVYRHAGIEPANMQIVVVKATVGHMDAYREIMKLNLPTECPGPSPSYLQRLNYRHIVRPMFPFDPEMRWSAEGVAS